MTGHSNDMPCTWWLSWLAVEPMYDLCGTKLTMVRALQPVNANPTKAEEQPVCVKERNGPASANQ